MSAFDTLYNTLYPVLFESVTNPEMGELACTLVSTFGVVLLFALPFFLVYRFTLWIGGGLH